MVETAAINGVLRWIRYWDDKSKITLINRISDAILKEDVPEKDPLEASFGGWKTDESAEEKIFYF